MTNERTKWRPTGLIKLPKFNTMVDFKSPDFWSSISPKNPQFCESIKMQQRNNQWFG